MIAYMIAAFGIYFGILIGIGIYFYHKNKKQSDFSVGGRELNYWITALSAQASDMSDWLFMAFPGIIYAEGLINIWTAVGLVTFMFFTWHFIAPKLRIATAQTNSITISSFFKKKFNDPTNIVQAISGILCLYFFIFYIAAGLVGLGRVFESAFLVDYHLGIFIGLAITLLYTLLGGLAAIAWSDFFQGIFLLFTIILVPIYGIFQLGGITSTIAILQQQSINYLSIFPENKNVLSTFFGITGWGIGYFGQPHILINFMSIDNPEKISKAKIVGMAWQILALTAAVFVGLVGKAFISPQLINHELVFVVMVKTMFHPFIAGIILCAILAATISTINTQALVSASLIANDLYYPFINNKGTEKDKLQFTRLSLLIIPFMALLLSFYTNTTVLSLVLYAWSGLGSSFGPLVILSLYSNFVTQWGAIAGLLGGGITAMIWPLFNTTVPTLVAGFIINFIATYIGSTMQRNLKK